MINRDMSASAVASAAAGALLLNVTTGNDMEEEDQDQAQRQKEEPVEVDIALINEESKSEKAAPTAKVGDEEVEDSVMLVVDNRPPAVVLEEANHQEQAALAVDAQLRAMAVSATRTRPTTNAAARAQHDTAPSTGTSTGTRSAGESIDDVNGKDCLKPFIRTCAIFESGSGSGDQDGMVSMEDGVDVAAKKRKTRRGKPKHRKLKPYSKQQPSYQQRLRCRATGRPTKTGRQPPAPYNTTQFLMEDHNDLPDLDEKLAGVTTGNVAAMTAEVHNGGAMHFSKPIAPPRTRDSSFSVDSDEDYFYSSPEDEEEFLTKEFSSAYEDLHAERLGALTKTELIQEYIQLEAKVDLLTKRLRSKSASNQAEAADRDASAAVAAAAAAAAAAEPKDAAEMAKKLKLFQQRIDELVQQNEQLRRENDMLRKQRHVSPMSSIDSESDSDSSSNGSACSCNHKGVTSPGSSPVSASYHAGREKTSSRRKNSSVSSVDSESDSTSGDSSCRDASPKTSTGTTTTTTTTTNNTDVANGHATNHDIDSLPT